MTGVADHIHTCEREGCCVNVVLILIHLQLHAAKQSVMTLIITLYIATGWQVHTECYVSYLLCLLSIPSEKKTAWGNLDNHDIRLMCTSHRMVIVCMLRPSLCIMHHWWGVVLKIVNSQVLLDGLYPPPPPPPPRGK